MRISVTLLCSYLYCKRKLFLERVLKLVEPPKEVLVIGSIKHQTFEEINNVDEQIVCSIKNKEQADNLRELYNKIYLKLLKSSIIKNNKSLRNFNILPKQLYEKLKLLFLNQANVRTAHLQSFILKHNIFGKELWKKLTPKITSEYKIYSKNLELSGIIDQLEVYKAGYVPVELKSGKMPKEDVWPSHKIQVGAYAMLLEEKFNKNINEGFIYYIDHDEKRHVPINPFLKEEIIDLKNNVKLLLNSHELPNICDNENKCNVCGLKNECFNLNQEKVVKKLKVKEHPKLKQKV